MTPHNTVLIYSEYWSSRGGGEKYLLSIAEILLHAGFDVSLIAQALSFDKDALSRYFKIGIEGAKLHLVPGNLSRLRWQAERLSRGFDVST